jgi:hypothetical protein
MEHHMPLPDPETQILMLRFALNIAASMLLLFGLFYQRYREKELAISASLFNLFIFSVLAVLTKVEFSLAAGFGLFAILAMFTLRSEPLTKIEITYFFGSVAIAVICSVQGTAPLVVVSVVVAVLLGTWLIDHPRVLPAVEQLRVTLDKIDRDTLNNPGAMREVLSKRLGVEVLTFQVTAVDYINDMARLRVNYRKGA